jgi:hypothetical protein
MLVTMYIMICKRKTVICIAVSYEGTPFSPLQS